MKKNTKTSKKIKKVSTRRGYKKKVRVVQKVINRNAEDKIATAKYPLTSYNSGITSTADIVGIVPAITNGTAENQRIANDINVKSLKVYANISLTTYATTAGISNFVPNSRIGVRVMVVQPKTVQNRTDINNNQGAWLSRLLRDGNNSVAFDGTLDNFYLPINSEVVTKYYDKRFFFNSPSVYLPASNTENIVIPTHNTFKKLVIKVYKKHKLFKYDASYDTQYPTQYNPVILLGYCKINNDTPDTVTTAIQMNFTTLLKYQDI